MSRPVQIVEPAQLRDLYSPESLKNVADWAKQLDPRFLAEIYERLAQCNPDKRDH